MTGENVNKTENNVSNCFIEGFYLLFFLSQMNTNYKLVFELCNEIGIDFINEEILDNMYKLIDAGIELETLIKLLTEIKSELKI